MPKKLDLILVPTDFSDLSHALMGSVAEKVVRQAPCPALTIKPKGEPLVENMA